MRTRQGAAMALIAVSAFVLSACTVPGSPRAVPAAEPTYQTPAAPGVTHTVPDDAAAGSSAGSAPDLAPCRNALSVALRSSGPGTLPDGSSVIVGGQVVNGGWPVYATYGDGRAVAWLAPAVRRSQWVAALKAYPETGLWPLLVQGLDFPSLDRPWREGEFEGPRNGPGDDAEAMLEENWTRWREETWGGFRLPAVWPGVSTGSPHDGPISLCPEIWEEFADDEFAMALVPAARPADVPSALGWLGATNYMSGDDVSTVLRRWERTHGAVPLFLSFDVLVLSVERPPGGQDEIKRLASEHFAFAPDVVWEAETFAEYAALVDSPLWVFWWD